MINIIVIHGPNLNLLGEREARIYGQMTLIDLNILIQNYAKKRAVNAEFFQSNHEGALIDFIHAKRSWAQGMVINPGALTHYSYALRDAVSAVALPAVEVHLSDISNREPFRKISVIKPVCVAQVSGLGADSYLRGIDILLERLTLNNNSSERNDSN
ncbi:MAG: type II 3-dehydroquinate dehydratase [bacterium]|nr:type II 3-dehydroquinate dehydratase [bacterium]